jgi:hypothetical protein
MYYVELGIEPPVKLFTTHINIGILWYGSEKITVQAGSR